MLTLFNPANNRSASLLLYSRAQGGEGKGASVRSDIHALSLVRYELYTRKRAFEARTLATLVALQYLS
ncbi:MAG: hypothetical protein ABSH28_08145 [Acidobacteriota bacterium]